MTTDNGQQTTVFLLAAIKVKIITKTSNTSTVVRCLLSVVKKALYLQKIKKYGRKNF